MPSLLRDLICMGCRRSFPPTELVNACPSCDRTLEARYDLDAARERLALPRLAARPPDLWRFEELLPPVPPSRRVGLGEVETPLLRIEDEAWAPRGTLWVKHDGPLPTGTFKARGMAMAVSRARELGARALFVPTAGNAGAALAAYARRAGLPALVYMPRDAPAGAQEQVRAYGAELHLVDGHIGLAGRIGREASRSRGAFDVSTLREPYRAEGKKTMGLELFWQMDRRAQQARQGRGTSSDVGHGAEGGGLPDVIVYPTGGGTGLVGMARAFAQLRSLGLLEKVPRLYAAQAEGCAPVVEALARKLPRVEPVAAPRTEAAGLRVPAPFSSEEVLAAVRATGGGGTAVPEEEIAPAARRMAARHGLSVARETGAALAAVSHLRSAGAVDASDRVLVYSTGTGPA